MIKNFLKKYFLRLFCIFICLLITNKQNANEILIYADQITYDQKNNIIGKGKAKILYNNNIIARTIAMEPKLIVCDESVSALDISVQAQVLNLLNELKEDYGFTYIFISHDLAVVKFMADQLLVMKDGKIEEIGDADEIYANPNKEYTQKLIESIPKGI